jgi:type VI secretion system secreted protein VgrG
MEDQAGKERILLNSPATQTFVRLGQPNDPAVDWSNPDINAGGKYGYTLYTSGAISITANTSNTLIIGENTIMTLGDDNKFVGGIRTDTTIGARFNFPIGGENKAGPFSLQWVGMRERASAQKVLTAGNKVNVIASLNKVLGDKLQTATLKNELAALKNELIMEYTKAIASQTKAMATKAELAADMQGVSAEATTAAASTATAAATQVAAIANQAVAAANQSAIGATVVGATMEEITDHVHDDLDTLFEINVDAFHSTM